MSKELETVNWPTLDDMIKNEKRDYKAIQIELDGKRYYRFVTSQEGVEAHKYTKKLADKKKLVGMDGLLDGYAVALDYFVRELVEKGYNPMKLTVMSGFDARYFPHDPEYTKFVKFFIEGMSSRFGKPEDIEQLKSDLIKTEPEHLNLHFLLH